MALSFRRLLCLKLQLSDLKLLDAVARLRISVNVLTVRWRCPLHAVVKLNLDGCSRGNPGRSGGRGLFRDSDGRFLLAFSCYFREMTSLQAEMKALLHGVRLGVARDWPIYIWSLTRWLLSTLSKGELSLHGWCSGSYKNCCSIAITTERSHTPFVRRINLRIDFLRLGLILGSR
mgnify:CR=1 FL=1